MTQENKTQVNDTENGKTTKKPSLRKLVLEWLGYLGLFAVLLFFFAPESWWQFGVSSVENRKAATAFSLTDLNGSEWSFADQRGKVVVVNYWATWCPPCRVETPMLVKLADEFETRGLRIVGIALDQDGMEIIKKFMSEYKIDYPVLLPVPGSALSRIDPVPTTLLIDGESRLAKKYVGELPEDILRKDIEKLTNDLKPKTGGKKQNFSGKKILSN